MLGGPCRTAAVVASGRRPAKPEPVRPSGDRAGIEHGIHPTTGTRVAVRLGGGESSVTESGGPSPGSCPVDPDGHQDRPCLSHAVATNLTLEHVDITVRSRRMCDSTARPSDGRILYSTGSGVNPSHPTP